MKQVFIFIGLISMMFGHNLLIGFVGAMWYHRALTNDPVYSALLVGFCTLLLCMNIIYYEMFIREY